MLTDDERKALEFTNSITNSFNRRVIKLYQDMKVILEAKPSPFFDTDELYYLTQLYKKIDDYVIDADLNF